jgi:hypothetical protein
MFFFDFLFDPLEMDIRIRLNYLVTPIVLQAIKQWGMFLLNMILKPN